MEKAVALPVKALKPPDACVPRTAKALLVLCAVFVALAAAVLTESNRERFGSARGGSVAGGCGGGVTGVSSAASPIKASAGVPVLRGRGGVAGSAGAGAAILGIGDLAAGSVKDPRSKFVSTVCANISALF